VTGTTSAPSGQSSGQSNLLPAIGERALDALEAAADVIRLRRSISIGIVLWIVAGFANDIIAIRALPDVRMSVALVATRVGSTLALLVAFFALGQRPTPRRVRTVETVVFCVAGFSQAVFIGLNRGIVGPGTQYMSLILLCQGVTRPRPLRVGMETLSATLGAFLVGITLALLLSPRLQGQWSDPVTRTFFLQGVAMSIAAVVLLAYGGNGAYQVRREAFAARQIGRYQLRHRLGKGGQGDVWRAYHPGLRREVALKVLRPGRRGPAAHAAFEREIGAIARLSHPATVRLVDRGVTEDGLSYFAMELVEGETLAELVRREGPLQPSRAVHLLAQIASALAEAHRAEVVHRDLTPDNVMVTCLGGEGDAIKILDFGLAGVHAEGPAGAGTPRFMAPEVHAGALADARADVFAIGALLVFMLTGKSPLEDDVGRVSPASLEAALRCLDRLPGTLRTLAELCLARDPAARPVDAAVVADSLAKSELARRWLPPRVR
jgi:serine/threonine-protein kinase